jgi:hypothetical protein
MNRITLTSLAAAAALVLTASPAAAKPITGTWGGELSQDLSALDEPYTTNIGFQAYKGRIVNVYAEVRMECPESSIRDARIFKSYRIGRGPKLRPGGGFSLKVKNVSISGALGKARGDGNASASGDGCHGNGTWQVKRR